MTFPPHELFLIVLWPVARRIEDRIVADLRTKMTIVADCALCWPGDAEKCFARFYGCKAGLARGKAKQVGSGEFRLLIVRDKNPSYEWRETSRGHERVNGHIFDLKARYREWCGVGHGVHATNTPEESRRDFYLLTGQTLAHFSQTGSIKNPKTLPGQNSWESIQQVFAALDETIPYTLLQGHDLLVSNKEECASILNAHKQPSDSDDACYMVSVGAQQTSFILHSADEAPYNQPIAVSIENALPVEHLVPVTFSYQPILSALNSTFFQGTTSEGIACLVEYMPDGEGLLRNAWYWASEFYRHNPTQCIKPLYYNIRQDGTAILITERPLGRSLDSVLSDGTMTTEQAALIANQISAIAGSLGKLGLCHRHICPKSLFLSDDGILMLTDFHFARSFREKREAKFMRDHWKTAFLPLNRICGLANGGWNDTLVLIRCLSSLPEFPGKADLTASLKSEAAGRFYFPRIPIWKRLRLFLSLRKPFDACPTAENAHRAP